MCLGVLAPALLWGDETNSHATAGTFRCTVAKWETSFQLGSGCVMASCCKPPFWLHRSRSTLSGALACVTKQNTIVLAKSCVPGNSLSVEHNIITNYETSWAERVNAIAPRPRKMFLTFISRRMSSYVSIWWYQPGYIGCRACQK